MVGRPHHVGDRQRLAGQADALGEVLVVEHVVVEHLDVALEQSHSAGEHSPSRQEYGAFTPFDSRCSSSLVVGAQSS